MAGPREEALRRAHVRALPLMHLRERASGPSTEAERTVDFYVGNPDGRVRTALTVMFVPERFVGPGGITPEMFLAVGMHGLAIMGRESTREQAGRMLDVDPVFGTLSAPVPVPGDTYGWLVSEIPDAREWHCRLYCDLYGDIAGIQGMWMAVATYTDQVGMSEEEWRRTADRIYLRGESEEVREIYYSAPT